MSNGGKGDARRPGAIPDGAWEAVFAPKAPCETCHGTGTLIFGILNVSDEYPCLECDGKGIAPCEC